MNQTGMTPMGTVCAVHRHRSSVPIQTHHVFPVGLGGPNVHSNRVQICADGHTEVHNYMNLLVGDAVPWRVRLRYGFRVRRLARQGWDAYLKSTSRGAP